MNSKKLCNAKTITEFLEDFKNISFFHRKLHKQYGDLFRINIINQRLIFVGGYKTTYELLVKKGDVLGDRPNFLTKQLLRNAGKRTMIPKYPFHSNQLVDLPNNMLQIVKARES